MDGKRGTAREVPADSGCRRLSAPPRTRACRSQSPVDGSSAAQSIVDRPGGFIERRAKQPESQPRQSACGGPKPAAEQINANHANQGTRS
jgi:hypothetical protein